MHRNLTGPRIALLALVYAGAAYAQRDLATLVGTVADPSGGVVAGAERGGIFTCCVGVADRAELIFLGDEGDDGLRLLGGQELRLLGRKRHGVEGSVEGFDVVWIIIFTLVYLMQTVKGA